MPKQNLYADGYQTAMRELAIKVVDEGMEAMVEYLIANCPESELAQRVVDTVSEDAPKDELCVHCREAIERRDGEIVSKYGNDPQCDASPSDNHRFR